MTRFSHQQQLPRITLPASSLIFVFVLLISYGCKNSSNNGETTSLGTIEMKVTSGSDEAISHFETGVLLLHSFMYSEAAESFGLAQEADKDFAMAYWGEAMTYNHPLWSEQNYDKATEVLSALADSPEKRSEKAPSDFEKDMLWAVEVLYGEGSKIERDDAYARHMEKIYEKYPENHEVAAFYALSLLGSVEQGRDYDVYGKGAKIAQGILQENPEHPGALHYLIHSYDDPDHASLALEAANSYSRVAPDAGHALHMPSHIYIALGMWDDVISSNIRSYDAKLKIVERGKSKTWNLHAYHWLLYGYLQKNDLINADQIMERMVPYIADDQSTYTRYYAIEMLGNYSAETGDWNGPFSHIRVKTKDLNVQSAVGQLFIEGYAALMRGDKEVAMGKINAMKEKVSVAANKLITEGISVCSGVSFASRAPAQSDIDISRVLMLELEATLAMMNGESEETIENMLIEATNLESSISFNFGPPSIYIPTYEIYGRWLLDKGRYDEAIDQFDRSLKKGPGRRLALLGKLESAKRLGDSQLVSELEKSLNLQMASS